MRSLYWEARQCLLWRLWPEIRLLTLPMVTWNQGPAGHKRGLERRQQQNVVLAQPGDCGQSKSFSEPERSMDLGRDTERVIDLGMALSL